MPDIITTFISIIPLVDLGKIHIEFKDVSLTFFKPIAGREHWSEENYKNKPMNYNLECKVCVYNGKRKKHGINNCLIELQYQGLATGEGDIGEQLSQLMNVEPGEQKEVNIQQTGLTFWGENLNKGYTLVFNYRENGKKKNRKLIIKKFKPTINIR